MQVRTIFVWAAISAGLMLTMGKAANAQRAAGSEPLGTVQPVSKDNNPSTGSQPADASVQPASKQENKAIKAFRDAPTSDPDKKTQLGEEFITTYPSSQYRPEVVLWLARVYLTKGQTEKLQAEGDKELALTPSNPLSLAVLGSNLSRAVTPSTPNKDKYLEQAQLYCQKSLEDLQSAKKPANLSDDKFTEAKNQTAATAYSGLGTVAFRNQKYPDAITNLDQAVKLGGAADPVNFYLLGKANEAATNFDQALAAYTKCAAIPGAMQAPCQASITDVKAHGAVLPK
jgi:tetratricopeptide (TPR) repeat protein